MGYGELSLSTTGLDYPMLAGNLASILISIFVCVAVSLIKPDEKPYDWEGTRNLQMVEEEFTGALSGRLPHPCAVLRNVSRCLIQVTALAGLSLLAAPIRRN